MSRVAVVPFEDALATLRAFRSLQLAIEQLLTHPGLVAPPHLVRAVRVLSSNSAGRLIATSKAGRLGVLE